MAKQLPKDGGILYTLVAKENERKPLAEENRIPRDNKEIAEAIPRLCYQLLDSITASGVEHKNSYNHDGYTFHYYYAPPYIFVCVTLEVWQKRFAYAFLVALKSKLTPTTTPSEFGRIVADAMTTFSDPANFDAVAANVKKADAIKNVMVENIRAAIERGEKLSKLNEQAELAAAGSAQFKRGSTQYKNVLWWEKQKMKLLLLFCLIVLVVVSVVVGCGFDFERCQL